MGYATWDAAHKHSSVTLSNGNLTAACANPGFTADVRATLGPTSGKWYWEVHVDAWDSNLAAVIGVVAAAEGTGTAPGYDPDDVGYVNLLSGAIIRNSSSISTVGQYTTGDVISIAYDADSRTIAFRKNNALLYTATGTNVPSGALYPAVGTTGNGTATYTANFGATAFTYTPPSGFLGLQDLLTFSMTSSGGVSVGGAAAKLPLAFVDMTSSGGMSVRGAAAVSAYANTVMTGSGGLSVGGTAAYVAGGPTRYNIADDGMPSGGVVAGGAAVVHDSIPYQPVGGVVAGGAAVVREAIPFKPSGGAVASGAADVAFVASITPSGGAVGSGTAARSFIASITPSGGGLGGGAANVSSVQVSIYIIDLPTGGVVAGGAATSSDRQAFYQASGGAVAGGSALAYLVPAGFTPTQANPYAHPFPGWNVNFETGAPARILGLPANSFAQLGGVTYVANAAGIFALDGQDDAGSPIRARVLLPKSDAASVHNKRVPAVWISGEMERGMVMQVSAGEDVHAYYAVDAPDAELRVSRVEPGRGLEGRFIQLGFGNVQGADFTLESVEAPLSILKRHGR